MKMFPIKLLGRGLIIPKEPNLLEPLIVVQFGHLFVCPYPTNNLGFASFYQGQVFDYSQVIASFYQGRVFCINNNLLPTSTVATALHT